MALKLVRILGWLVIAHGLSHAALPLRGSLDPMVSNENWMPVGLYAVGMIGFVGAGLGLLGVRPFERAISPLLVLASAWSLVAIFCLGDPELWPGAASDVALLLVGLWRAYGGWPSHPRHGRVWHVAAVTAAFSLFAYVGVAAFTYPSHRTWGSTGEELSMSLPGDAEPRERSLEVQHGVTINAPAEDVWAWLVQIGQDRAGFYSYDWLERAIGLDIHNVQEVRPEWQALQVGDVIRAAQPGYLGGLLEEHPGWEVLELVPEKTMVLDGWGTFALQPAADEQTRLIIRSTMSDRSSPVWATVANLFALHVPHFIMQREMMLTIKALAEERYALRSAEDPVRTIDIVATDDMKYSLTSITAEPGEEIRIRLHAKGVIPKVAMAHNVVVLQLDTDIETLLKEGAPFRETDFIPPTMADRLIAKTKLAGPGERVQVTFTVPETPADYPFLCTFAGHYQAGMKGTLIVR
jgi:azurin